jgi:AcrR family transcriptional regulator
MRPSTSRNDDSARRGREVLDAAAEVFTRQGYDGTSIDDIADELGATKGRVYHYYRSKAELLIGIVRTGNEELIDVIAPMANDTSRTATERLTAMAYAHAMTMMTSRPYQFVNLQSLDHHLLDSRGNDHAEWEKIRDTRREYEALFIETVEDGVRTGEFSTPDVKIAVRGVLGSLNWITVWYRPEPDGGPGRETSIADTISRFAVAGLTGAAP